MRHEAAGLAQATPECRALRKIAFSSFKRRFRQQSLQIRWILVHLGTLLIIGFCSVRQINEFSCKRYKFTTYNCGAPRFCLSRLRHCQVCFRPQNCSSLGLVFKRRLRLRRAEWSRSRWKQKINISCLSMPINSEDRCLLLLITWMFHVWLAICSKLSPVIRPGPFPLGQRGDGQHKTAHQSNGQVIRTFAAPLNLGEVCYPHEYTMTVIRASKGQLPLALDLSM